MKLVIPVSRHDRHLIPAFLKSIEKFNPGSEHELLVFGSREVESDVLEIEAKIKHLFNLSETLIIDDTMLGWPMSCNFYFQQFFVLFCVFPHDKVLVLDDISSPFLL
jgi:hypothetical protein